MNSATRLLVAIAAIAVIVWIGNDIFLDQQPRTYVTNTPSAAPATPPPTTTTTTARPTPATRPDRDLITAATSRNWSLEEYAAFDTLRATYFPGASDRDIRDTMYSACKAAGAFDSGADFVITTIIEYPELAEQMGAVLGVLYVHNFCDTTHQWRMIQEAGDYLGFGG